MNKIKFFTIISIFCILAMVPIAFAGDGDAALADETVENVILTDDYNDILTADYYFDANATDDTGDGSASNPYKDFKASRVVANSNLHLANGEYTLDKSVSANNVKIIGDDPSKTILKYTYGGTGFTVSNSLTLKNLTLVNLRVYNNGAEFTASNTIFKDYQSSSYKGGVIESHSATAKNVLDSCTFNNTYANYGGSVYLDQASLTVTNTIFDNTRANLYGGTIVAMDKANVNVKDSKFLNSKSLGDAGGAIYLESSSLLANNLEINNCSATFGGAITALKSNVDVTRFTARNNKAKYDGGAIYSLYTGPFSTIQTAGFYITDSIFENNIAENAGAVFVYNIDSLIIKTTQFIKNQASDTAGAYYSVYLQEPYYDTILDPQLHNTFAENKARTNNDVLEAELPETFIGSNDYMLIKGESSDITNIPSKYDLRELNQVTAVKDQGNDGNCWAFSTLGALESSIKKATGIEFDFSEENMKDLMCLYSMYGWDLETNTGGYDRMGYAYLVNWLGPVNESDDTYKKDSVLSPILNSIVHVQNILLLKRNNYTDNDAVKMAIMNYGGVATSLYSTHTRYQYYTGSASANHAAVIVGWDDSLEFKDAPGKGGWIVKNSWGTNFGDNGFFYVSYYDTKFAQPGKLVSYAFIMNDSIKYDKNYQYDIPGRTDYFYNSSSVVWYKNKFKATDNEYIAAVSTYFEKESDWEVSIYVNNKLKLTQSGHSPTSYKTVELNQLIPLSKGDVFEVVFKINVTKLAAVPISQSIPKGDIAALNTKFYTDDMSYISYDGKNWQDLNDLVWTYSTHEYESQVACIKAFTVVEKTKSSIELQAFNNYNPIELKATVRNQYGNLINSGIVTFNIEGKAIKVNVVNGIASLNYSFDSSGTKTVTAKFSDLRFYDSDATIKFFVQKISTQLTSNDVTTVYNGGDSLVAVLKDANGKAMSGKPVKIVLGDVSKTLTTDNNGEVSLSTDGIVPNIYTANIAFAEDDIYYSSSTTAKVTINKVDSALTVKDFTVTLKDANGNPIGDAKISVKINSVYSTLTTDNDGKATISTFGLDPNNYTADIAFAGDKIYNPSSTTAKIVVEKYSVSLTSSDVTTVYNGGKSLVAVLKDANGKAMSGTKITIKLADISKTLTTDKNGEVSLSTDGILPNTYTANIAFAGDDTYYASSTTAKVTINKLNTDLTAGDVTTVYNGGKDLVAVLKDANGKAMSGAKVTVMLAGVSHTLTTDKNGEVSLSTDGILPDEYLSDIAFAGDAIYNPSSTTAKVTINKINTALTAVDVTTVYNGGKNFVATLKDANNIAIGGHKVTVKLDKISTMTTDADGQVSMSLDGILPEKYVAKITFDGDAIYNPSSTDAVVTINKLTGVLTSIDVETVYRHDGEINVTLKDEKGNPMANSQVNVQIGTIIKVLTTDSNGKASMSTKTLMPNTYTTIISYAGNDIYSPLNTTSKVVVYKEQSKVYLRNALYFVLQTKYVTVTLWDANNNPVIGKTVYIELTEYGLKYSGVTDENGEALIRVGVGFGEHSAKVSFEGDDEYNASERMGSIRVIKETPSVMVRGADTQFRVSDNPKIVKVHLRDRYNKPLPVGSKIFIKVNGQTFSATTDSQGIAHVEVKLNYAGTFNAQVIYAGNSAYNKVTRDVKIYVK